MWAGCYLFHPKGLLTCLRGMIQCSMIAKQCIVPFGFRPLFRGAIAQLRLCTRLNCTGRLPNVTANHFVRKNSLHPRPWQLSFFGFEAWLSNSLQEDCENRPFLDSAISDVGWQVNRTVADMLLLWIRSLKRMQHVVVSTAHLLLRWISVPTAFLSTLQRSIVEARGMETFEAWSCSGRQILLLYLYGGAHHNSSLAPLVFLVRPAEYHLGDQLTVLPRHSHLLPMLPEAHL